MAPTRGLIAHRYKSNFPINLEHQNQTDIGLDHYYITHFDFYDSPDAFYECTQVIDLIPRRNVEPKAWEGMS